MLPHIQQELAQADFDIDALRVFLAGGPEAYARRQRVYKAMAAHPGLHKTPAYYSLTREQKMDFNFRATMLFFKEALPSLAKELDLDTMLAFLPCMMGTFPLTAHSGMFVVQLEALGSEE